MDRARRGGRGYDGVTDEQIYQRDKWVCLMPECACPDGVAIDPALTGTGGSWAPSIDHVIPLSEGGLDNARNKRAAHTKCNGLAANQRRKQPVPDVTSSDAFQPAAAAAAQWWVRWITDPEREHPATPEAAAVFAAAIEARVAGGLAADMARGEKAAETGRRPGRVSFALSVDYHPDNTLRDAADTAGIRGTCFPSKTTMLTRPDHVVVSRGYGVPFRLVWADGDWQRPPCDWMRPEDGWYSFADWAAHPSLMVCGLPRFHDEPHGSWIPDPTACRECGQPQTAHYTRDGRPASHCPYADEEEEQRG